MKKKNKNNIIYKEKRCCEKNVTVSDKIIYTGKGCKRSRRLAKKARYYIPELELVLGGDTLMQVGLVAQLQWGDFTTKTFTLERIEK